MDYSGKKVVVGLTGRIASGVTAFLLKKQGFQVIGVSILNNPQDAFENPDTAPKCHIYNLDKIKNFCDHLGIPFYATDGKREFEDRVLDPFTSNKLTAKANTTCFNCTALRVEILYQKMKKLGAEYISTGHFCKIHKNLNSDIYSIHANNDLESDQSYLLSAVNEKYLKHMILPLGELRESEVKTIAKKFNLPLEASVERELFCYREPEMYSKMLEARIPKSLKKEGQVQNIDTELVHGEHKGVYNHYVTEKNLPFSGVNPNDKSVQIVGYDFSKGIIEIGDETHLSFKGCQIIDLHFSSGLDRTRPMNCFIKNKYSQDYLACTLYFKNNNSAYIEFEKEIYPLIAGEQIVIFDRNTRNAKVIGTGQICDRGEFKLIDRAADFKTKNEVDEAVKEPKLFKF